MFEFLFGPSRKYLERELRRTRDALRAAERQLAAREVASELAPDEALGLAHAFQARRAQQAVDALLLAADLVVLPTRTPHGIRYDVYRRSTLMGDPVATGEHSRADAEDLRLRPAAA